MFVANEVANPPIVHPLRAIFRIPNDLVDEVAEVENKADAICLGGVFILENHPAISILRALIGVLAAHKYEPYGFAVVIAWCCDCPADPAAIPIAVGEAIPVDCRGLEAACQDAASPIRTLRDGSLRPYDNLLE